MGKREEIGADIRSCLDYLTSYEEQHPDRDILAARDGLDELFGKLLGEVARLEDERDHFQGLCDTDWFGRKEDQIRIEVLERGIARLRAVAKAAPIEVLRLAESSLHAQGADLEGSAVGRVVSALAALEGEVKT